MNILPVINLLLLLFVHQPSHKQKLGYCEGQMSHWRRTLTSSQNLTIFFVCDISHRYLEDEKKEEEEDLGLFPLQNPPPPPPACPFQVFWVLGKQSQSGEKAKNVQIPSPLSISIRNAMYDH